MKRIINGKTYNTATATLLVELRSPTDYVNDFRYEETRLYRSPKGAYFLAGSGGALSRWSKTVEQNQWTNGFGLELVDEDEARLIVEEHGSSAEYVAAFGEPVEG